MSTKKTSVFLVAAALLLFVLLFNAPKQIAAESRGSAGPIRESGSELATLDVFLNVALKNMTAPRKAKVDQMLASRSFDSLSVFWTRAKRPDLSAFYTEELAKLSKRPEDWFSAGNRYYYSVQFTRDKSEIPVLYQSALRCLKAGLAKDPNNVDARIMVASCYVDGTDDPMQGITLLRELERTDSNNVKLQITFASFSIKSGQYDKAIRRFKKVLELDSTYIEAYLHLADAYEQTKNKTETIRMLEAYAARTPDVLTRTEVNKYIKQLKDQK